MTKEEIDDYLKKHISLVFRYNFDYYSIKRNQFLFWSKYSLIATDESPQQRNSLNELCEQVYICKGTPLIEAIKHMEILEFDDPLWTTYRAVKHNAIVYKNEILFFYNGKSYWIAHASKGKSHLTDDFGNTQWFDSCRDLFDNVRIDGNSLEEIWGKVVVSDW